MKEGKYSIPQDIPSSARDLIERILVIDPTKRLTVSKEGEGRKRIAHS